jgi:glycosyltransferase involved in cell wall biosynthesis
VPYVPHDQVFKYLNETDALFLAIPEAKNNEGILTGKLFEYLASQKPILCIGPVHGDAAKIIQSCETGQTFEKENGHEILIYLQCLVDAHKEERRYFTPNLRYKDYSRENLTKELSCILNTM